MRGAGEGGRMGEARRCCWPPLDPHRELRERRERDICGSRAHTQKGKCAERFMRDAQVLTLHRQLKTKFACTPPPAAQDVLLVTRELCCKADGRHESRKKKLREIG